MSVRIKIKTFLEGFIELVRKDEFDAHTLNFHDDVNAPTPSGGDRLTWNNAAGLWEPAPQTYLHADLTDTTADDSHPISAITGLATTFFKPSLGGTVDGKQLNNTDDLDNILIPGFYSWTGTAPINAPSPPTGESLYAHMLVEIDAGQPSQFCWGGRTGKAGLSYRRRDNGTWQAWEYWSKTDHTHPDLFPLDGSEPLVKDLVLSATNPADALKIRFEDDDDVSASGWVRGTLEAWVNVGTGMKRFLQTAVYGSNTDAVRWFVSLDPDVTAYAEHDFSVEVDGTAIARTALKVGRRSTGADFHVVESGSNSNGNWVKYYDGTMIQYGNKTTTGIAFTAVGNIFRAIDATRNFPIAFNAPPAVTITPNAVIADYVWGGLKELPAVGWLSPVFYCHAAVTQDVTYSFIALGRWKA